MLLTLSNRIKLAARAALIHLCISAMVAALTAWLVLRLWYPPPYDELSGGRGLFLLLMSADLVCGPLLTLVLFNPVKPTVQWRVDLILIVSLQLGALGYGMNQVAIARPVFLAFEGNRFRVVQASDIDSRLLVEAPPELATLGYKSPRLIGTRLASPTDPEFPRSVQLSLQGIPPAFRPARWLPYAQQRAQVLAELKPLALLKQKNSAHTDMVNRVIDESHLPEDQLGYLPLVQDQITDWVVVVGRGDALPKAYLHLDGW